MPFNENFVDWNNIDLDELLGEYTDDENSFLSDSSSSNPEFSTSEVRGEDDFATATMPDAGITNTKGMCIFFSGYDIFSQAETRNLRYIDLLY